MVDFTLRPMTIPERKYSYAQSSQLQGQTGNIGYLRGDFGSSGDQFYTTWFDTRPQWKSDEFKRDLDDVINALRSEEYGLLQSRSQMVRYGRENKESEMQGAYTTEFGFRADTEKYAFVLRCNPTRGDYNFYCLCYVKEWLDKHIEEANRDIRFIDSHYKELFRIPDGERIIVTDRDGKTESYPCRYIDNYHTEVGRNLFHICEFAERMEQGGCTYAPTVTFGSNKIVWWKGACGHEWQTSIKARSAGEQCPICSGARVLRGYNDFESKFPELAKEWSPKNEPLRPSMITAATHRKVIWQCKLGHEWTASVKSRTVNGTGCPYCSHNFVLPGFNDLASRFPEIAAEWSERNLPLTPDQVTAFKNIKVWWKCHLGHEWNTLISTHAGGSQCPYCSGIKLLKGFNDLKTKYPFLAAEWSEKNLSLTPDAVNEKSTKNVWWKCNTCGYEWKAVVKARVKGGMCPVCAERAVLQGYNDLGTTDPYLLSEWDYEKNSKWTPSNVSRNSMKVVWWKCGAGHSYRAKITDRTIEQKGCPQCEAEFQQALPQMLIMMYGAQNGITVKSNSDSELGMRLVAYLPELHCAVDIAGATVTEKREQSVKAHICQSNRLGYYLIKRTADASQMAAEIKTLFIRNHIYLHTDSEKDVQVLRERFLEWKYRNACKLNGKY